jgi:hypothetical protein
LDTKSEPFCPLVLLTASSEQRNQEHTVKTLYSVFFASLIITAAQPGANGQAPAPSINPASLYYQAFLVSPEVSEADHDFIYTNEWQGQPLPDRFGRIVGSYDNEFKLVRAAAHSTDSCDWGIDMSEGPATLLPHLARTKGVVLMARFRALWDFQQGRQADAHDDLLAAFALGRNVTRDGTLISCLVQQAMEMITCRHVAELFGRFSKDELGRLLAGLEAAPARRTVAECVGTEGAFFRNWALRRIQELQQANPGNDAQVMAGIREMLAVSFEPQEEAQDAQPSQTRMSGSTRVAQANPSLHDQTAQGDWWARLSRAAGGTSAGVVQLIRDLESSDPKLAAVLSAPANECEAQMAQFKAELQQSPNPLPSLLLPPWEHRRVRELRALADLGMVRAAIVFELHGQAAMESVKDPWAEGPFAFQRFVFQGVDRGFMLTSAYPGNSWPESVIFVEKDGPPFSVDGRNVGQPRPRSYPK